MSTKTRPPQLTHIEGGGWVVSSTLDIDLAQLMAAREAFALDGEHQEPPSVYYVGWMRWNPCHESSCYDGGGHCGHIAEAAGPGRGNWLGVWLDDEFVPTSERGVDVETVGAP